MKKGIIIIVIIISLIVVAGYFAKKQFDKVMKYCYNYNIKQSKINKISSSIIDIDFALDFKNNSDLEAQIDGYNFDILLNDVKISHVSSSAPVKIKSKAFTTITIPIKVNVTSLLSKNLLNLETAKNLISDRSKIMIGIKGVVSAGALGLKVKDMPIEISMSLTEMMAPSTEPTVECK